MLRVLAGLLLFFCLFTGPAAAEESLGTIAGVVIDGASGDPLIDAGVEVIGQKRTVRTDIDGRFTVKLVPGTYELRIFAPLYQGTRLQNVRVIGNQVTSVSANLKPEGKAAEQVVEVVARADRAAEATQLLQRKNADVVSDNIGAQTIQKSPDSDAGEVVQRLPAVTLQEGSEGKGTYVYVRGLGERYSSALLDGSRLPSTDPNRRVVSLDLFPADFIESLSVIKSYLPDLPGDFSGGLVDIRLKQFPETLTAAVSASIGASTNSTFHRVLTSDGGDLDYFGFGADHRALPDILSGGPLDNTRLTVARARAIVSEFNDTWEVSRTIAAPNFDFGFNAGNSWGPLGVSLAANYETAWKARRNESRRNTTNFGSDDAPIIGLQDDFQYDRGTFQTTLGSVLSAGYEIAANHRLSGNALINRNTSDETQSGTGGTETLQGRDIFQNRLRYTEDQLWFTQLGGKHRWDRLQVDWRSAYAETTEDEPDTRDTVYTRDSGTTDPPAAFPQSPNFLRTFADLNEYLTDTALDLTIPFETRLPILDAWAGLPGKFKTGIAYAYRDRDFRYRRFQTEIENSDGIDLTQSPEAILLPRNYGPFLSFQETTQRADSFDASQEVAAAYGMLEFPIVRDTLRVVGGARVEYSYIQLDGADRISQPISSVKNDLDPLPGVSLIYSPRADMNVRYGYSMTVSRPEFRELTPTEFIVPGGERTVIGEPGLRSSTIDSHDLRWEWFFSPTEIASVSLFYKEIAGPIERIQLIQTSRIAETFQNARSAELYGFEIEGRKNFSFLRGLLDVEAAKPYLNGLSLQANVSYIKSDVELNRAVGAQNFTNDSRALQGQAPFVVNSALEYAREDLTARLLYNTAGRRIEAVGALGLDDIYAERRDQLDLVLNWKITPFGTPLSAKLAVENILNDQFVETQKGRNAAGGTDTIVTKHYTEGVKFSLGVSYSF